MRVFSSRLSITRQFMLLAILGVALSMAGLILSFKRSYDLAFEAKRTEAQHVTEAGASLVQSFIRQAQSGAMTTADAQKRALEALRAVRFAGGNYYIAYTFDGDALAVPNAELIGTNRIQATDANGKKIVQAFVDVARSARPGFVDYVFAKPGETLASPKISYIIGCPEWRWLIGSGLYVDDVTATLGDGITRFAMIFVPLMAGFAAIVVAMYTSVSGLLIALARSMTTIADGDLGTEIAGYGRGDEIGQMAEALSLFRQARVDKITLEDELLERRQIAEAETRRKARFDEAAMAATALVVRSLGASLEQVARGDLASHIAETYPAEYEIIRENFNNAIAQLRETMSLIAANAAGIRTGSIEIATASDNLAQRTERQAATLAQTAVTLGEIAGAVGETAKGSALAREIVSATMGDTARSDAVVRGAIAAMSEIENSAREIAQIIGVIDEIAFQTNLLALNAGVEAARAGDAGRGFAVVAAEVRALAQRSAEAAKDIKRLILASTEQVEQGVAQVAETGKALGRIQGRVAEINAVIVTIAASAQNQATSLAEVNTAIDQMDKSTQHNAAMVEQSTAASHTLASEVDRLTGLIDRFALDARRASADPRRRAA